VTRVPRLLRREDFDDIFKVIVDRDGDNIHLPYLSDAIEACIDSHCVHAVAKAIELNLLGHFLKCIRIRFTGNIKGEEFVYGNVARAFDTTRRGIRVDEERRLLRVDIETNIEFSDGLFPIICARPPIRFATAQNAEGGGALLPIDNPQIGRLSV